MRVLHDELGGSMTEAALAASPVVRTLQVYLLKELRRLAQLPQPLALPSSSSAFAVSSLCPESTCACEQVCWAPTDHARL